MHSPIKTLQQTLLSWFKKHQRNLPWRKTTDPYAIWVSEVMLQQTRVDTVISYWERFLHTFPTLDSLAQAKEQKVLSIWQGLGYYRRARHMHEAAKEIIKNHAGHLPQSYDELIKLKGFGTYTAGSVASIAFGQKVACVDGNVKRVLSRIFATHDPIDQHAHDLAHHNDPSSINQSIMELGALICTPKNPKCLVCPIANYCKALQKGSIEAFPKRIKKTTVKNIHAISLALLDVKTKKYFFQKRTQKGRWENMWEFPYYEFDPKKSNSKDVFKNISFKIKNLNNLGRIQHQLTHQNITVDVYSAQTLSNKTNKEQQWRSLDKNTLPTSVLQKKIQRLLG